MDRIKKSTVNYHANELTVTFQNADKQPLDVTFRVSNNDLAFRYELPRYGDTGSIVIRREATGFDFPSYTTTFLAPQSDPMVGWKRTKPSYEEEYAADAPLTQARLTAIVREKAFSESTLAIPRALQTGEWPLLDDSMRSVLQHKPTMPLTLLEKRWMKALLADPRIALFDVDASGLEDVQPLYSPDVFVPFDRYADGDPYDDPTYIACFRTVLQAIRELITEYGGTVPTSLPADSAVAVSTQSADPWSEFN